MTEIQKLREQKDRVEELELEVQDLEWEVQRLEREVDYSKDEVLDLEMEIEFLESRKEFPITTGWDEEKLELLKEHWDKITLEDVRAITEPI